MCAFISIGFFQPTYEEHLFDEVINLINNSIDIFAFSFD